MTPRKAILALTLTALSAVACEPPATTYRRSALIPSKIGGMGISPMIKGESEFSAALSAADVVTKTPSKGDPALHVAQVNAVGQLRHALSDSITIGGQLQGAHRSFSEPNAEATPPLREDLAWGVGPNISISLPIAQKLTLGASVALTYMNVPWASWEIKGRDPCGTCQATDPRPNYTLYDSGRDSHWLYRGSLGPVFTFNRHLNVFGGMVLQNSMTNIGFDNTLREGSTITTDIHHATAFMGLTVRADGGPFLRAQLLLDAGGDLLSFTHPLSAQVTLGLSL
jgi:hypothetical protein